MTKTKFSGKNLTAATLAVVWGGALVSCAVGPDYRRPELAVPTAFKSATEPEKAPPVLGTNWWTLFNEPELTRLVEETLAANLNIKAAMARVEQARAAARGSESGFFPAVNLNPAASRSRAAARTAGGSGTIGNSFSLPLDASYEPDVWGRLRRQYEYYRNSEQASADDFAFVRQTAAATLAQAYFNIRLYDGEVVILNKALDLYRRQLDLTGTKFKAGLALQTDLLQARTQVNSATNQLLDVQRSRARQEHAIAILLGRSPADFTLEPRVLNLAVPVVPAGLPATLLSRRPDVMEAEHRLAAANAQVGVAQANFYPTFSLTGAVGFQSTDLARLTDWQSRIWSLAGGLTLPIFQGGKLTAALEQSRASYREQVASYRTAVLTAFQDVEDQLSDLHLLEQKAVSLEETLVSAREYFRLTELQYKQGLATYLQVINANQTLLTNEISAAETQSQRLAATVLLIKALGGGWSETAPQPSS